MKQFYEDTVKPFIKIILTVVAFMLSLLINNLTNKIDDVYKLLLELKVQNATVTQQIKSIEKKNDEQDTRLDKVETRLDNYMIKTKEGRK